VPAREAAGADHDCHERLKPRLLAMRPAYALRSGSRGYDHAIGQLCSWLGRRT
jgi:hypothetical protein